jgi:hypothetical protein
LLLSNSFYFSKGNTSIGGNGQQDEDGDEMKKDTTKKKRKEIDLPIIARVSGATKPERDRLIQQEVIENLFLFFKENLSIL